MIETYKKSALEALLRAHGLHPSKALGQNFLADPNIAEKIVACAALSQEEHVLEIGSGLGALTVLLAEKAGRVTAVELDRRLMSALAEATAGLSNILIDNEDFLKYDLSKISAAPGYKLVGNLPYYITTPILVKLYEPPQSTSGETAARPPTLAVLMMQKEVAERLVSSPGKKTYGAISVLVQYYTEPELMFSVSREVFVPKPGVDSAVVRLTPRELSGDDPATALRMFRLVRAGFDMRRKTLRNSLARAGFSAAALAAAHEQTGIDPARRAETLSPRDFYALAAALPINNQWRDEEA